MIENKAEIGGKLRKVAEGAIEKCTGVAAHGNSTRNDGAEEKENHPLKMFSLKGNQICGSILIGNYNYLTQLEVNENEMEVLDLGSLAQLESLICTHNKLTELMLNGSNLCTLQAPDNYLKRVTIKPMPHKLTTVNLSRNHLNELPKWLKDCYQLQTLDVSHNQLQSVSDFLRNTLSSQLEFLDLSHNFLRIIEGPLSATWTKRLKKFFLQSNELITLPENFFEVQKSSLIELNLSCNKLSQLPPLSHPAAHSNNYSQDNWHLVLERIWLCCNNFNEGVFNVLQRAPNLKVLHLPYNKISCIPPLSESCPQLEELVLSGNLLQHLPSDIGALRSLQTLNVHSNLLLSAPVLHHLESLKFLDLSYNHLHHLNLTSILNANLKYLDISGNSQLQVDEDQVQVCRQQRKWSLIDVTGKRRRSLPTSASLPMDKLNNNYTTTAIANSNSHPPDQQSFRGYCGRRVPWFLGFSENPGYCRKLLVAQLREQVYRRDEALIGMFATEMSSSASSTRILQAITNHILNPSRSTAVVHRNEGQTIDDMTAFMTRSISSVRRELADQPLMGALLCHLSCTRPASIADNQRLNVRSQKTRRYMLRLVGQGDIGVFLVRRTYNVQLHPLQKSADDSVTFGFKNPTGVEVLGTAGNHHQPDLVEWHLNNDDEYLVVCNAEIYSYLDIDRIAREVRKEENVMLAAKRLQNIAQGFGARGNLSALVIRFRNLSTDVDSLINELKRSVKCKPYPFSKGKRTCCSVENALGGKHTCPVTSVALMGQMAGRSERSSPSGQSDRTANVLGGRGVNGGNEYVLAHARVLEETNELEMVEDTDSALSEEQFKCWEYMLEQNTQLLFDKELNTISRSFIKNRERFEKKPAKVIDRYENNRTNLLNAANTKYISSSSPHLLCGDMRKPLVAAQEGCSTFLSRHFGSARSFGAFGYNLFEDTNGGAMGMKSKLSGGPNAAYFGSLQRLMPHNLEYDFVRKQDRNLVLDKHLPRSGLDVSVMEGAGVLLNTHTPDSNADDEVNENELDNDHSDMLYGDHQTRMQKYWGVATTEL